MRFDNRWFDELKLSCSKSVRGIVKSSHDETKTLLKFLLSVVNGSLKGGCSSIEWSSPSDSCVLVVSI